MILHSVIFTELQPMRDAISSRHRLPDALGRLWGERELSFSALTRRGWKNQRPKVTLCLDRGASGVRIALWTMVDHWKQWFAIFFWMNAERRTVFGTVQKLHVEEANNKSVNTLIYKNYDPVNLTRPGPFHASKTNRKTTATPMELDPLLPVCLRDSVHTGFRIDSIQT